MKKQDSETSLAQYFKSVVQGRRAARSLKKWRLASPSKNGLPSFGNGLFPFFIRKYVKWLDFAKSTSVQETQFYIKEQGRVKVKAGSEGLL